MPDYLYEATSINGSVYKVLATVDPDTGVRSLDINNGVLSRYKNTREIVETAPKSGAFKIIRKS